MYNRIKLKNNDHHIKNLLSIVDIIFYILELISLVGFMLSLIYGYSNIIIFSSIILCIVMICIILSFYRRYTLYSNAIILDLESFNILLNNIKVSKPKIIFSIKLYDKDNKLTGKYIEFFDYEISDTLEISQDILDVYKGKNIFINFELDITYTPNMLCKIKDFENVFINKYLNRCSRYQYERIYFMPDFQELYILNIGCSKFNFFYYFISHIFLSQIWCQFYFNSYYKDRRIYINKLVS